MSLESVLHDSVWDLGGSAIIAGSAGYDTDISSEKGFYSQSYDEPETLDSAVRKSTFSCWTDHILTKNSDYAACILHVRCRPPFHIDSREHPQDAG